MREYLFRGKRLSDGKWCEGFLTVVFEHTYIEKANEDENCFRFLVAPETVGQYTGLTDKNGTKIFEGDMFGMDEDDIGVVIFKDGCFRLEVYGICGAWTESGFDECGGGYGVLDCDPIDWYSIRDMEVIGNIHDNPELLEV